MPVGEHRYERLRLDRDGWREVAEQREAEVERLREALRHILAAHDKASTLESDGLLAALIEAEDALRKSAP